MPEVFAPIALRTILVSGAATALAVLVGVPVGYVIARRSFRGRTMLLGLINTGMGMPPVVVGLVVWLLLVRSGPFGDLELIYTQRAMVLAQCGQQRRLVALHRGAFRGGERLASGATLGVRGGTACHAFRDSGGVIREA